MTLQPDVLIIGAGLSGLMAARTLIDAGMSMLVLDKGRSVGGRMATRRIENEMGDHLGLADHGAQFFSVRDPVFRQHVNRWLETGLVFEWSRGWSDGSGADSPLDGYPRYAVRGGMNALTREIAHGIDVQLNAEVVTVTASADGAEVIDTNGVTYRAKSLLLTAPVPQSLRLLDRGSVALDSGQRAALDAIQYDPCIACMVVIDGETALPEPGAVQRPNEPLAWIADNRRKGLSNGLSDGATILTLHANPDASRRLYDAPNSQVSEFFRAELAPFLDPGAFLGAMQIKRWRYSQPQTVYPQRCLGAIDLPLWFAGDAFGGPRVEGAVLSGIAAGEAISKMVSA